MVACCLFDRRLVPRPSRTRSASVAPPSGAEPGDEMNRRTALRILALAASIGLVGQALLLGNLLGVNAPILTVALLGAALVVRPADRRMDPLDVWLPAGAVVLSLGIAVRADPVLDLIDAAAACGLLGASMGA